MTKIKLKLRKDQLLKIGLKNLIGWIVKAFETGKERGQFYFLVLFCNIF